MVLWHWVYCLGVGFVYLLCWCCVYVLCFVVLVLRLCTVFCCVGVAFMYCILLCWCCVCLLSCIIGVAFIYCGLFTLLVLQLTETLQLWHADHGHNDYVYFFFNFFFQPTETLRYGMLITVILITFITQKCYRNWEYERWDNINSYLPPPTKIHTLSHPHTAPGHENVPKNKMQFVDRRDCAAGKFCAETLCVRGVFFFPVCPGVLRFSLCVGVFFPCESGVFPFFVGFCPFCFCVSFIPVFAPWERTQRLRSILTERWTLWTAKIVLLVHFFSACSLFFIRAWAQSYQEQER